MLCSIYNVMGYSILVGFSSAIETLCGMVRSWALQGPGCVQSSGVLD